MYQRECGLAKTFRTDTWRYRLSCIRACRKEQTGKVGPEYSPMYILGIWRWWVRLPVMEPTREESDPEPRHSIHEIEDYCQLGIRDEGNILRVDRQRPVRRIKGLSGRKPDTSWRTIWTGRIWTRNWSNHRRSECWNLTRSRIRFGWRADWRTGGREPPSKREKAPPEDFRMKNMYY